VPVGPERVIQLEPCKAVTVTYEDLEDLEWSTGIPAEWKLAGMLAAASTAAECSGSSVLRLWSAKGGTVTLQPLMTEVELDEKAVRGKLSALEKQTGWNLE
jgi:hypothetical protein